MAAVVLPLPSPLYSLAKWVGLSAGEEEEQAANKLAAHEQVNPECDITDVEEQPMSLPDCASLNTPPDSDHSVPPSASCGSLCSQSDGHPTPDTLEFERFGARHVCVQEKMAPTKRVLFSSEDTGPLIADESDDDATRKCAAALTRLMILKNKLAGELGQAKAMDSVVVSSNDLKDENLKLRLEIAELQKQVQERDEYIERTKASTVFSVWNPLGMFDQPVVRSSMATAMCATPRTKSRILGQSCSTWLATPVPLGEDAPPESVFVDKLVTL